MLGYGIKETTTTTGTGTLTLSAVSGFARFSDKFAVGNSVLYSILDSNGAPLEIGIGTVGASNTLLRDRVQATYSGSTYNDLTPAAVSLSGTSTVICTGTPSSVMLPYSNVNTVNTLGGSAPQRVVLDTRLNLNSTASTGLTLVANRLYLIPFYLGFDAIVSGITLRIGTGVASTSMRAGLYQLDHRGFAAELIGETAETACATSGVNWSASFTSGNKKIVPGLYHIGFVSNGAPAIGTVSSVLHFGPFGISSGANIISPNAYAYAAHTFGALPEPVPTALTAVGIGAYPCVGLTIV